MEHVTKLLFGLAIICTLITVITEFTKQIGILKRIPTAFQVLITSVIVCQLLLFGYLSYASVAFAWYYPVGALFAAFFVAIICTEGWEYLFGIIKRFYIKKNKED